MPLGRRPTSRGYQSEGGGERPGDGPRGDGDLARRDSPPKAANSPPLLRTASPSTGAAGSAPSGGASFWDLDGLRPNDGRRMGDLLRPRGDGALPAV